ncbi:FHA domain-containing protein [Microbacterium sp. LWH10-1.2]
MVCANCGTPRRSRSAICPHCGQPFAVASQAAPVAFARAVQRPHPIRLAIAVSVDVAVSVLITVIFSTMTSGRLPGFPIVVFFLAATVTVGMILREGRTVGLWAVGARVVGSATLSAPGLRERRWLIADTRNGADPVLPHREVPLLMPATNLPELLSTIPPLPASFHRDHTGTEKLISAVPEKRAASGVLVVDDAMRVTMAADMLVGRSPSPRDGVTTVAVPDLDRELSKGHFRITQSAGVFTVTDLSSTNGTLLNGIDLTPSQPTTFHFGDLIEAGGHRFRVEARSRPENGGAQ